MILIVCWMHSNVIWKWTWRACAQLLQMPLIGRVAVQATQRQASESVHKEASVVRVTHVTNHPESAIASRRSTTVEDTPKHVLKSFAA